MQSVLIVCDLIAKKCGTYERFLARLGRTARAEGVHVALLLADEPAPAPAAEFRDAGLRWLTVPGWKDAADRERPGAFLRMFPRVAAEKPWDLVVFNFCNEFTVLAACALARLRGRRFATVWVQHSEIRPAAGFKRLASRIRLLAAFAGGVILNTRAGRRELLARGCDRRRLRLIHNAVRMEDAPRRGWLRGQLGLPADARLLASVGSLILRKGFDVLLDAAAPLLTSAGPPRHLLIMGDGPLRGELTDQARRLGVADRVHFLGVRDDVPDVLADCDLFVLATRAETLTLAVLEAMAAGLPVVTTDVGGHRELISDGVNGRIVPADDVPGLRAALTDVLDDEVQAREFARRATEVVARKFELQRQVNGHLEFYRKVCARNGHGAPV